MHGTSDRALAQPGTVYTRHLGTGAHEGVQADPRDPDTPPDLPDDLHDAVLDTWPLVQQDVFDEWMARTDPAAVAPRVPRVMRDAADLVRRHGGVLGAEQDTLVERLGQDVEARIQREFRRVLRDHAADPASAVAALRAAAADLRLPIPTRPDPLPEIELDDVRVIAWVAVHPGVDGSSATIAPAARAG